MPIPDKIRVNECLGKYATTDKDIETKGGQGIVKGSRVKIVSKGRGLTIETCPCPCCGQYTKVRGVNKNSLTLENSSSIHIRCSSCGHKWKANPKDFGFKDLKCPSCNDGMGEILKNIK